MRKKKMYACLGCLALLAGIVAYQTFAYFTEESITTNVVTTGYVEMELIVEDTDGIKWGISSPEITSIMPGDTVSHTANITNTGSEDFYARVSLEVLIESAKGDELDSSVVTLNIDEDYWIEDEDGWYRYTEIVKVGETTEHAVFDEIYFSTEMDNEYIGSTITIRVGSQSVQSEYNEYVESVLEVQGFPESEVTE